MDEVRDVCTGSGTIEANGRPFGQQSSTGAVRARSPFTVALHKLATGDLALVGGKAANLWRLLQAGFPVPTGFCLTTGAFKQFIEFCPRALELARLRSEVPGSNAQRVRELAEQIRDCLAGAPVPDAVREEILAAWRGMGAERIIAVRSSATVEDGSERSFAGQFKSVLNVQSAEALLGAVKQCWLSLYSAGALSYQAREHSGLEKTGMAVLVQDMVPAELAGVIFTLDPVSGDPERMVVEAVTGLGESLVSGRVQPETVVMDKARSRVIERRGPPTRPPLDEPLLIQLAGLATKAEGLFRRPLDIEWAANGGRVFLLQARPATALRKARAWEASTSKATRVETTNDGRGRPCPRSELQASGRDEASPDSWEDRQHWSNVNTGEIFPDVATPMTWSVVQLMFPPLFGSLFRLAGADITRAPAAGLVAGRIYFNANTGVATMKRFRFLTGDLAGVARAIGGGETCEHVLGIAAIPDSDIPDIAVSWPRYILSWPRILYDLLSHLPHRADRWLARLQARIDVLVRTDVRGLSTRELMQVVSHTARESVQDWDLLYLMVQTAVLPLFQKACRDWLADPQLILGYRLFAGLGGVPEAEAGLALWRLAALAQADAETKDILLSAPHWAEVRDRFSRTEPGRQFLAGWDTFMSEHGHHCRGELELFNARWSETPDYILRIVCGYIRAFEQTDLPEKQQRLAAERRQLTEQCLGRLTPLKRRFFAFALRRAQKLAVTREAWKNEAVRQFAALRRMLLELGRRFHGQGALAGPDDVFFLELPELEALATGNARADLRQVIRARRDEYEANLKLAPPSGVIGKFNPQSSAPANSTSAGAVATIRGIAVSPGVVTGTARVILHTDVHDQVAPGEILVAPFTDPAWTPYFIAAAGVVIDQGGVLSHGSIVARELGIPAITSAVSATRMIRTGDLLQLDANAGQVTILKRGTP